METEGVMYYGGMIIIAAALVWGVLSLLFIKYRRARMEIRLTETYGDVIDLHGAENQGSTEFRMAAAGAAAAAAGAEGSYIEKTVKTGEEGTGTEQTTVVTGGEKS